MSIDYAAAGRLLEAYGRAWESFDGDAWTELFSEDAAYHEDPFDPPLVGRTAIPSYLLHAAEQQQQVEFTVERHWVSVRPSSPPGTPASSGPPPAGGFGSRAS